MRAGIRKRAKKPFQVVSFQNGNQKMHPVITLKVKAWTLLDELVLYLTFLLFIVHL